MRAQQRPGTWVNGQMSDSKAPIYCVFTLCHVLSECFPCSWLKCLHPLEGRNWYYFLHNAGSWRWGSELACPCTQPVTWEARAIAQGCLVPKCKMDMLTQLLQLLVSPEVR